MFEKRERYTVKVVNGKAYLVPKDVETEIAVKKQQYQEHPEQRLKKKGKKDEHLVRIMREYEVRERIRRQQIKAMKLKEKAARKREWERKKKDFQRRTSGYQEDIDMSGGLSFDNLSLGSPLSLWDSPKKQVQPQKTKYVVIKGKAYPKAKQQKKKKKPVKMEDELKAFSKEMGWW